MTQESSHKTVGKPPLKQDTKRQQKHKSFLGFIAITLVLVFSLTLVLFNHQSETTSSKELSENANSTRIEYNQLIINGDQWLAEGKYDDAASEYRTALQLFPQDSVATFRLISASDLNCKVNSEDCGESERLMEAFVTP